MTLWLSRLLNGVMHGRPVVLAREAESRIGAADRASLAIETGLPGLFFCRDLQGYDWCARKGSTSTSGSAGSIRDRCRAAPAKNAWPRHRHGKRGGIFFLIRQAVESGLLATQTIVEAHGHFSRDRLEPYAACLEARCAGSRRSGALARIVADRVKTILAGRLLEVPTFVKRVVLDQWFLHRHRLALET